MKKTNNNQTHDLNGRCPTIVRYGIENLKSDKDTGNFTCKFCRRKIEKIKMGPSVTTLPGLQNNEFNVPDNIFTSGDINPLPVPSEIDQELAHIFGYPMSFAALIHLLKTADPSDAEALGYLIEYHNNCPYYAIDNSSLDFHLQPYLSTMEQEEVMEMEFTLIDEIRALLDLIRKNDPLVSSILLDLLARYISVWEPEFILIYLVVEAAKPNDNKFLDEIYLESLEEDIRNHIQSELDIFLGAGRVREMELKQKFKGDDAHGIIDRIFIEYYDDPYFTVTWIDERRGYVIRPKKNTHLNTQMNNSQRVTA